MMSYTENELQSLKSSQPNVYHRTFRSELTEQAESLLNENVSRVRGELPYQENTRRAPRMGPPSGTVVAPSGTSGKFYDAFYEKGQLLIPTRIWQRADQDFTIAATKWEQWWSTLFKTKDSRFVPIIDVHDTVIGHHGIVNGPKIYALNFDKSSDTRTTYTFDERFSSWDLLVGNGDAEESQGYRRVFNEPYRIFEVQVGQDGVIASGTELANKNGHADEPDVDPIDLITTGKEIVRIVGNIAKKVGAKATATIVRRFAAKRVSRSAVKKIKFSRGHEERMGIPSEHFEHLLAAAKETDVIVIMRANKVVAIELIRQGAHGKPMWVKWKSDPDTGLLKAIDDQQRSICYSNGVFVVDAESLASRQAVRIVGGKKEYIKVGDKWKLEEGQVFFKDGKPVVGDYDLLGVAPVKSPGSNVSGVPSRPAGVKDPDDINELPDYIINGDWNGPWVQKYTNAANSKLGEYRILHGSQDAYGGKAPGLSNGAAYAIYPDGKVHFMTNRAEQEAFYAFLGREIKSNAPAPVGVPGWKPTIVPK